MSAVNYFHTMNEISLRRLMFLFVFLPMHVDSYMLLCRAVITTAAVTKCE